MARAPDSAIVFEDGSANSPEFAACATDGRRAPLTLDFISYGYTLCSPSGFVVSGTGTPPIQCSSLQDCPTTAVGCGLVEGFLDAGPICVSQ
jgi:hypothetical protein